MEKGKIALSPDVGAAYYGYHSYKRKT